MIELPETYVLAEQINETVAGKTIANVQANAFPHKFAWYSGNPDDYQGKLTGKTVISANPGTGYTCGGNTEIICGDTLLVISTPIKYHAPGDKLPAKHQLLIEFEDFSHMSCTVQMWGAMFCYEPKTNNPPNEYKIPKGPNPMEEGFDKKYFDSLREGLKPNISAKAFLATEQRIPGLGNGVLQDILFNCKIHPKRKLQSFTDKDFKSMYHSVRETLLKIKIEGGRDTERDLYGASGGYKTILSAKTLDKPCPACGGTLIREAFLGGNIYFCPHCQPMAE